MCERGLEDEGLSRSTEPQLGVSTGPSGRYCADRAAAPRVSPRASRFRAEATRVSNRFSSAARSVLVWVGRRRVMGPVRRALGRGPVGGGPSRTVAIEFEGRPFSFTAPEVVAFRARDRGVENIICRTLLGLLEPGAGFVDVGANYGFVTMVGAHGVGATGRILAIEAEPDVASVLQTTVRDNGFEDRAQVAVATVGAPGDAKVTVDDLVDVGSMDEVDAVKIDVDGTEPAVLAGMVKLVDAQHPVLIVEVPTDAEAADAVLAWLRERYVHIVGMHGDEVEGPDRPPNVFASIDPISVLDGRGPA